MNRRRLRLAGFTLIEVLIATAVIAIAMGVFISGGSQFADNARYLQDKTLALWVARNRMTEFRLAKQWPDTGKSEGRAPMGDRQWQWRADVQSTADPAVRRVDIEVHAIDPDTNKPADQKTAVLSGFLTNRNAQAQIGAAAAGGAGQSGAGTPSLPAGTQLSNPRQ